MATNTLALIAVQHLFMAQCLENVLRTECREVLLASPREALEAVRSLSPDIAIIDLPLLQLPDFVADVNDLIPSGKIKIIYLAESSSSRDAAIAFQLGISAYVPKHAGVDELLSAMRKVAFRGRYLSSLVSPIDVQVLLSSRGFTVDSNPLSSRQMQVLQLLTNGLRAKEVADRLNVKTGTVNFHKYRIMKKLKVNNKAELIRFAISRFAANEQKSTSSIVYR